MEHFYQNIGEDWFNYQNLYSKMVSHFVDGSHFVEIGSWKGRSSSYMAVEILNSKKRIKFDCIDIWCYSNDYSEYFKNELKTSEDNFNDFLYLEFLKNIQPVSDYINPIKLPSIEASKLYNNRSLDFVFIDGSHEYEEVCKDILSWYPKVKIGGFLAGHDYSNSDGVTKAVNDLIIKKNIPYEIFDGNSWVIKKN